MKERSKRERTEVPKKTEKAEGGASKDEYDGPLGRWSGSSHHDLLSTQEDCPSEVTHPIRVRV